MLSIDARFQVRWQGFSLDVDLHLPGHGITAFFGHSGSGKTTMLRCIAGLERSGNGVLRVGGETWQDEKTWLPVHRRPIGYVFQEANLFTHLTVMGNLRYGQQRSRDAQRIGLEQAIELLGIAHLLERKPENLSGGERQRVAIARALAVNPGLLLMDEPLAALDMKRKQEVLPYLERLHEELEIPVLYVSHAADEVARLADHLVVLDGGRVLSSAPLQESLARVDFPIRLGEDAGTILDGCIAEVDADWHLVRVEFPGGSLWARDQGNAVGRRVRVRVLARDVSLAREPGDSSIQNVLQGVVDVIADDSHPGLALVRMKIGDSLLLARLTKRAVAQLGVAAGKMFFVQVKSVALLE